MKNLLFFFIIAIAVACGNNNAVVDNKADSTESTTTTKLETPRFEGTIVYKNTATGDSMGAAMFNSLAPSQYAVSVRGDKLRIKEKGGITGLNLLINFEDSLYYQLNSKAKTVTQVTREDYGPYLAKIVVEKTDETQEIMGHICTKYIVKSSPFVNAQSSQELWVTEDFNFPYEQGRYIKGDFDGILPLPVISDIGFGTILKAVSVDRNTVVTMEAVLLETETLAENFEIPENYEIIE